MTVATTTARNVKTANGVTTSFPFDFAFEVAGDLIVNRVVIASGVETLQTLTTDYTVTGGSGATGTIEMVSAPPSTDNLVIERSMTYTQSVDYQRNDPFPAEVNETALDRLTFLIQQVLDFAQRSIKLTKTTTLTDVTVPDPEVGKILVGKTSTEYENKVPEDFGILALPVSVADGGTGSTTTTAARAALAVPGLTTDNVFTKTQSWSSSGPHAIGGSTDPSWLLKLFGSFTTDLSGGAGLRLEPTITAIDNGNASVMSIAGTLVETATGTHSIFAGLEVQAPTVTGGAAALTSAATVRIAAAPSGATNNYALWIDGGNSRFDGAIQFQTGGLANIGTVDNFAMGFRTNNTEVGRFSAAGVLAVGTTVTTGTGFGDIMTPNESGAHYSVNAAGTGAIFLIGGNSADGVEVAFGLPTGKFLRLCNDHADNDPVTLRVGGVNGKQITAGANDSGGSGFKYLRVPN